MKIKNLEHGEKELLKLQRKLKKAKTYNEESTILASIWYLESDISKLKLQQA